SARSARVIYSTNDSSVPAWSFVSWLFWTLEGEAMRLPFRPFQSVVFMVISALGVAFAAIWFVARWYMLREFRQTRILYHAGAEREHEGIERKLREQINYLRQAGGDEGPTKAVTDRIFGLLQYSAIAANGREVESWRGKQPSPERTAVALKWA